MIKIKMDANGIVASEVGDEVPTKSQRLFLGAAKKIADVHNPQRWTFDPWKDHIFKSTTRVRSLHTTDRLAIIRRFERGNTTEVR